MNILSVLGDVLGVAGGLLPGPIGDAARSLGQNLKGSPPVDPATAAAIQAALFHHQEVEAQIEADKEKNASQEALAEINSSDKFVSRARPAGVWAATAITTFIAIIVGVCMLNKIPVDMGAIGAMTSLLIPLWGHAVYYAHQRTEEKKQAMAEQ